MKNIAGLLLAAGASSRMGKPKQLLPLGRESLLEHALDQALRSEIDMLVLVLGYQSKEIMAHLAPELLGSRLRTIENPRYAEGISTSIVTGLSLIESEYDNTLILLGDMPWITSALINLLIRDYLNSGLGLGAVKTERGRTLPVIVGRKFYPHLHKLRGDVGARELFLKFPGEVCLVEANGLYEDTDVDTPEDYRTLRRAWKKGNLKGKKPALSRQDSKEG